MCHPAISEETIQLFRTELNNSPDRRPTKKVNEGWVFNGKYIQLIHGFRNQQPYSVIYNYIYMLYIDTYS